MFDFKGLISALFSKNNPEEGVYNLRSATQMLQELPESDMLMAQVEIIQALKQLNKNEKVSVKERFRTIPYLDEKARGLQEHLIGVYRGKIIDKGAPLSQVLLTITAFWNEMGNAYQLCLKQAAQTAGQNNSRPMATFTLRAMRYYFEHTKWCYMRYMELDSRTWRHLNRLYLFAEMEGFSSTEQQAYTNSAPSSIRAEYIKILMLTLAAPEKLQPGQIELVAEWLDKWVGQVKIETMIRPQQQLFAINVAGSTPPKRIRRDMAGDNWRYWNTDSMVEQIKADLAQLQAGIWATELGLPEKTNHPANIDLLQNLCKLWSRDIPAPARKQERKASKKTIRILHGLDAIINHINRQNARNPLTPAEQQTFEIDPAHWSVDNESTNGLGVNFQNTSDDKLYAGEVIGVLPENDDRPVSIGIVRRLNKRRDGKIDAGIETLITTPLVVNISTITGNKSYRALFSPGNANNNQNRFLLIPQKHYAENREYTLSAQGKAYRIRLSRANEHTVSATVTGFSVLAKVNS